MTDPGSVTAAYAVVVGGITAYVVSMARRLRAAQRAAAALERARSWDTGDAAGERPRAAPTMSEPWR